MLACSIIYAFPDAHHVVGGDGDHVVVVVRGRHLVNDDIVSVEWDFARIFQMIILKGLLAIKMIR